MKSLQMKGALRAKKTVVTVMVLAAMTTMANAASFGHDNLSANAQTEVSNTVPASVSERDVYRDYALQSEENEQHIIRYYDIERIVISNKHHAMIRIYDDKWQLIEQTRDDVDRSVRAGDYYVTCSSKIKGSYRQY